ncbi:hypothetical protein MKZ38_004335 [Zalerion maritima]|uniref:Uncharacterized protein n=1 Tax=Zalerion maritima TaxID=339359 RepID=A0AAD5RLG6_9PEZI|nr:hypothetical protein MKZ38_004335 [Zalerion maritima]
MALANEDGRDDQQSPSEDDQIDGQAALEACINAIIGPEDSPGILPFDMGLEDIPSDDSELGSYLSDFLSPSDNPGSLATDNRTPSAPSIPSNMDSAEGTGGQADGPAEVPAQIGDETPVEIVNEDVEKIDLPEEVEEKALPIPLFCHVCPSKPQFSDLSHLLTHLSSKSHLAQKHQTKLESFTDPEARDTLNIFKAWKKEHKIDILLAERYAEKKKKSATAAMPNPPFQRLRSGSAAGSVVSLRSRSVLGSSMVPAGPSSNQHMPSVSSIKEEPMDGFILRQPAPMAPVANRNWMNPQFPLPPPNLGSLSGVMNQSPLGQYQSIDATAGSGFATPHNRRELNRFGFDESSPVVDEPSSVIDGAEDVDEVADFKEDTEPKLKGAVWPGMGLFDSATQEQKRKRNQRKGPQVLATMKRYSEMVQPTYTRWSIGYNGWIKDSTRGIDDAPSDVGSGAESDGDEPIMVRKSSVKKRRAFNFRVKKESSMNDAQGASSNLNTPTNKSEDLTITGFSLRNHHRQHSSFDLFHGSPGGNRFGGPGFGTPGLKLEQPNSFLSADRAASPLDGYSGLVSGNSSQMVPQSATNSQSSSSRVGLPSLMHQQYSQPTQFGIGQGFKGFSNLGSPTPSHRSQLRGCASQTMLGRPMSNYNGYISNTASNQPSIGASRSFEYTNGFSQADDASRSAQANGFQASGIMSSGFQSNGDAAKSGFQPNSLHSNTFQHHGMGTNGIQTNGGGSNDIQSSNMGANSLQTNDMNGNGFPPMNASQGFNSGITQAENIYSQPTTSGEDHVL